MNRTPARRHSQPDDRGFTLVEILIAIVLVGILSAVVVVGIGNLTSQGSTSACKASADAARAATTIHFTTTGSRPNTMTAMVTSGALTLPQGVTLDSTGLVATGDGWTLTMTPGDPATFNCTTGGAAAAVPPAVPTAVPVTGGLATRLDASALAAMFQDSTGTTATTAAGQRICRWADTSGTNTHATQSSTALCPKYGTDATGGYVDFDANGFLAAAPALSPDLTVFVVAQSDTPTWNTWGWLMSGRGANGLIIHPWLGTRNVDGNVIAGGVTYPSAGQVAPADITIPHLYELSSTGNTPTGRFGVDGSTTAYTLSTSGRVAATVPVKLGADGSTDRFGDGKYREVLIFNRALSTTEMASVEAYLKSKWKLN